MEIIKKAIETYNFLFVELMDPRVKNWPLVGKPYLGLTILAIYLMFVLKWGPKWMEKRRPYNLDKILIVYNAFQVLISTYLFVQGFRLGWGWKYAWVCEPVNYDDDAIEIVMMIYIYFLTKILDLLDTVFFVLRKKNNQISFLHVYHHTGMVMLIWGGITYYPGGHGCFVGIVNSFVHACMYSYYLLSVAVPRIKYEVRWKKLLTQLQIVQFIIFIIHMSTIVFVPDCKYPRWISALFIPQDVFMLIMFTDFYIKTYIKSPKPNIKKDKINIVNGSHQNGIDETLHSNGTKEYESNNAIQNGIKNRTQNGNYKGTHNGIYNGTQTGIQNGIQNGIKKTL